MALQVWLPLNGDIKNQGLSNFNIVTNNVTFVNTGKIGQCANFNGSNSYIYINNIHLGNNWSYGCWINTPISDSRGWEIVIILNNTGSDADSQLAFWVHQKENRFETLANTQYNSTVSYAAYYGTWHHFFATFNGNVLTTYMDGIIVNTKTITAAQYTGTNLTIGARCTGANGSSFGNYFQGQLNDVRLYDHCLSAKEVKEISQGLILHYKLNNNGMAGKNLAKDTANKIVTGTASGTDVNYTTSLDYGWVDNWSKIRGKTVTISCDIILTNAKNTSGVSNYRVGIEPALKFSDNSTGYYGIWITLNSTPQTSSQRYTKTITLPDKDLQSVLQNGMYIQHLTSGSATIKYVKVELGSTATPWSPNPADLGIDSSIVHDSSGYNNNGIITGSLEIITPSPKHSCATSFDNKEYIIHKLPENMYQATYSFWVKASSYINYGAIYMPYQSPSAGTSPWFAINTESCKVWAYFGNNSPYYTKGSGTMSLNEWHHCVYVWNNGVAQWYVDGEKNGNSVTYTGRTFIQNTTNATIGNSYTGTSWNGTPFNGQISDFRIYATALTPAQIKELYETSKIIDGTTVKARDLEVSA